MPYDAAHILTPDFGHLAGAPPLAPSYQGFIAPISTKQQYYGGPGHIAGTTVDQNGQPISRLVLLYDRRSFILLRSQWSDEAGQYRFEDLDPSKEYTLLAHDYKDQYNAVVADNVTPEIAP